MNIKLKTLLNKTQPLNGFIYDTVQLETTTFLGIRKMKILVAIRAHKQRHPIVLNAASRRRAMIACRRVPGTTCRSGTFPSG